MKSVKRLLRNILLHTKHDDRSRERQFFLSLNLSSKTVYDIGSSIGNFALLFAEAVKPSGKVVAFEPNPEVFVQLKNRVEENYLNNTLIHNIGIGEKNERKKLFVRLNDTGTASIERYIQNQIIAEGAYNEYEIAVYKLDEYVNRYNLPKPDFVKIDVEGMEYPCLLGMKKIIDKYKPMFFIEIHGADLKRKQENIGQIVNFMDQRMYSIRHFESGKMILPETATIAQEGHIFCW